MGVETMLRVQARVMKMWSRSGSAVSNGEKVGVWLLQSDLVRVNCIRAYYVRAGVCIAE